MLLSAVYLFLLLALPTTAGDGNESAIDAVFVDNATGSTTAPGSPEWKAEGDLQLLTGDLPAGYSGKLTSQDGRYSCQLGPDVAVSEYLVKDAGGNVTFSIFLKDPTKILEKEPIVVQADFGSTGKLNICFHTSFSGVMAAFCPDGADPVLLVGGTKYTSTFEIMIFDDGRVQGSTEGKIPTDSPMLGKLVGRPLSATDNATAVKFSMTVLNATTEVFLQLSHGAVATMVQNQKDVPAESSFSIWYKVACGIAGAGILAGIIIAIVYIVKCVRNRKPKVEPTKETEKPLEQKPNVEHSTYLNITIGLDETSMDQLPAPLVCETKASKTLPPCSTQKTTQSGVLPVCKTQETEPSKQANGLGLRVCPTEQTPAEEGRSKLSLCKTQEMPADSLSSALPVCPTQEEPAKSRSATLPLCPTQEMAVEGRSATLKVADTQMSAVKGIKSSSLQVDATQAMDAPDDAVVRAKASVLDAADKGTVKSREKRVKTCDGNTGEGKKKNEKRSKAPNKKKRKKYRKPGSDELRGNTLR